MIEASHLSRRFGRNTAVSNVSFQIDDQAVVGLLGPNGAGKTTIMRMLSGYLEPTTGQVRVDGEQVEQNALCIQRQLGYLPESLPVYPDMMVADYLDYAATIKGIKRTERLRSLREVLSATDLTELALAPIGPLSRGQKQRVGVAQALLGRPRYLILDEPTNGLDPQQTRQMRSLIRDLARNATVIVSTHILQEVEAVCDRVLILNNGKLVMDQPLQDLYNATELRLQTGTAPDALEAALSAIPGISDVAKTATATGCGWQLTLQPDIPEDQIASEVSRAVQQSGVLLYGLEHSKRGLEDIFNEVVSGAQ